MSLSLDNLRLQEFDTISGSELVRLDERKYTYWKQQGSTQRKFLP